MTSFPPCSVNMAACRFRTVLCRILNPFRRSADGRRFWAAQLRRPPGGAADSPAWVNRHEPAPGGRCFLWTAVALSLFSRSDDLPAETQKDEMILLLKRAKLSMYRGQLQEASGFLHRAVVLAHQTNDRQGIIYTYSLMANLAYIQGELDNAEKLFKAAMSFMLSGGTPEDDNAVIEMSLKLATIYAEQNRAELAEHGFRFCTESLEAKLKQQKEELAEERTEELEALRKETHLLLGLCLDSRARYRASTLRLNQARQDYQEALSICRQEQGDAHPQTLVLMSDLATVLDLQGHHDEALTLIQQAVDLSRSVGHPDQHVLLGNLAGILLHAGHLEDSVRFYKEALGLARQSGDQEAVGQILEGLTEVKKRRNQEEDKKAAQN
ncbi:tetratricopeptide repeat protein 19, mitochondrial isoform X1 [Takifugu flavidus]|uniref:Tetratricopeptide repeat protein 19, mitochondrial n=2 Tax=Takifugu flavidus TaxID=433684 RepID=A0A5C6P0T6_9TELE|nr:tetratricopeptide repeat protein 19, mitochondrial isoform X1 [Takifugu flavidus]TWW73143.1 Tetratricopeptide repeat protein 19, mitochondrial [Takifugu flavidus]